MVINRRRGTAIVDTPQGILVCSGKRKVFLLPGGGAEKWESRKKAAIRELKEETGLRTHSCKYIFYHKGSKHKTFSGRNRFRDVSKVFLIKAMGNARPRHEIKHIAYYKDGNVNVSYNTKKMIDRYLKMKKPQSIIGLIKRFLDSF
jgi:ADP-ribose pyrophosphatase YjhB (NUDIX family)